MTLAERLRSMIRPGSSGSPVLSHVGAEDPLPRSVPDDPAGAGWIAETLGGDWRGTGSQRYLVVDRLYPAGYRLGRVAIADCLPDDAGGWSRLGLLMTGAAADLASHRLLFFDLETTGLAGGAGTYAFLVGCGWFDGAGFRVRQFLLTSIGSERPLLEDVASVLGGSSALVTYNGKTFDAPLIETRFLFHRLAASCAGLPHIDLLHAARRLWRSAGSDIDDGSGACGLSLMERSILGHVRDQDVPSFEIPSRYFRFVRSGDVRGLTGVLEHNRLDLLALAMLMARAGQLLDEGAPATRTAREALGLGALYERGGMRPEARACYARAVELDAADVVTRAEGLRAYAILSRRERRYLDAAEAWRRILMMSDCPPRLLQEAAEALAVHHEHRARDLPVARRFAWQTLQYQTSASRARAVHHRLARLDRKMESQSSRPAALF